MSAASCILGPVFLWFPSVHVSVAECIFNPHSWNPINHHAVQQGQYFQQNSRHRNAFLSLCEGQPIQFALMGHRPLIQDRHPTILVTLFSRYHSGDRSITNGLSGWGLGKILKKILRWWT